MRMYDSLYERSCGTEQKYVKRLSVVQIFTEIWPEKVPEVKHLRNFSADFNTQGLQSALAISAFYF